MNAQAGGILGGCLIVAALIVTLVPRPSASAPAGPSVGRYQIAAAAHHAYVLDTATGQVWETYASDSGGVNDEGFKAAKVK